MTPLSDDDIDREVALIEGWIEIDGRLIPSLSALPHEPPLHGAPRFSREWHWCGPLLEKIQASVFVGANFTNVTVHPGKGCQAVDLCDRDTKRAICLAYIAANTGASVPNIQRNPG